MASVRKRTWQSKTGEKSAWVVSYSHQGRPHLKTFKTKKAADAWRAEMQTEQQRGMHTPASASITVAEAAARWLEQATADGLETKTVANYAGYVKYHIEPFLGDLRLVDLSAAGVTDFRNRLIREGRSPTMVTKAITSLGSIISHAMSLGLTSRNSVREASQYGKRRQRLSARHQKRLEIGVDLPTKDELRLFLAHASGRWRPLIVTVIFTGLRASELRGLTWADVDLDRATLTVRQRADWQNIIGSPKSAASRREIPLAPIVVNTLKEWRLACPKGPLGLVFPDNDGRVASLTLYRYQAFGKLQKELGMCKTPHRLKYAMHAFRHAAASLFIDQGLSPKRIQALMGHSSIKMTFDVYGHIFPAEQEDAATMKQLQAKLIG
jgi:integrase